MFARIRQWLKRRSCPHQIESTKESVLGVTLGWSARPEVLREWRSVCKECGCERVRTGYLPRMIDHTPRGANDWPLMPDGSRMPIAQHTGPGF